MSDAGDEERAEAPVPPTGAARRGPAWVILAIVAAALLVCCCSAVIGLAVSWSAGLFHPG
ncbi:hypothetical protein K7640_09010 [Micromonospora sp. PLK6-60]|uniref:hypothetical protein n=1 Tax=Micromonospora sp. PLK6-60 TaxID=2873383 RepID=UPI001CA61C70|nr:hypothetical protein [Micromonospora sp. PLK6-60]MBY8871980.1 hypothetical protein [Micromonospora sp. PLK6-60]